MVGQNFLVFSLTRNPPKQRLRRVLLPTHKHRNGSWEILYLSSVRPRFSISLVTSAISSFSLWVQTERGRKEVMKQKEEGEGIIILIVFFLSTEAEGKQQQTSTCAICVISNPSEEPSGDALILLSQWITHGGLFHLHLTDQHPYKHFPLKRWPTKTPKNADMTHTLADRLIIFLCWVTCNSHPLKETSLGSVTPVPGSEPTTPPVPSFPLHTTPLPAADPNSPDYTPTPNVNIGGETGIRRIKDFWLPRVLRRERNKDTIITIKG